MGVRDPSRSDRERFDLPATGKSRGAEMAWVGDSLRKLRESGEWSALVEKHLAKPRPEGTFHEWGQVAVGATLLAALLLAAQSKNG